MKTEAEVDAMMRGAGWEQSAFKASGELAPFYRSEGGHFIINGRFGGGEHAGVGGSGDGFFHKDPIALAQYLIDIGNREARPVEVMAPPPPDPITIERVVEVEKLVDNPEHLARIAELEAQLEASRTAAAGEEVIPEGVIPFVKLPELPDVPMIPADIANLMHEGETLPEARRRLVPKLQEDLQELKERQALTGEVSPRRADVERLLGLFAKIGEA